MLVDQKTGEGIPAPFFGRDAMTTPAPAALALKFGSVLLPASAERFRGAHFRMHVHPAIQFSPSGDNDRDVLALTAKINEPSKTSCERGPRNGFEFIAAGPARATKSKGSGFGRGRRRRRARGIELELKPVEAPMRMRAGGATGLADQPDHLPFATLSPTATSRLL